MAEVSVTVEKIHEIKEHPNADRLELAIIGGDGGYQCCVQKGVWKAGDKCVYFPVDSVLPTKLEDAIFGKDAKVKLSKSRVKTIKLRGAISQGMAVPIDVINSAEGIKVLSHDPRTGLDVSKTLGVTKYEPPQKGSPTQGGRKATSRNANPHFDKYTNIQHLKKYPEILKGEQVVAFEKIHGTNFRAGWVKFHPETWWERLKYKFGLGPKWKFVYGSHNVQLQGKYKDSNFYSKKLNMDVYSKIVRDYDLKNRLNPGEVIYGEIYGDGIQKNYCYGCKEDQHRLVVVDLKNNGDFISAKSLITWCTVKGFEFPPILFIGTFSMEAMDNRVSGPSRILHPESGKSSQRVREGLVVRPVDEKVGHCGRLVFKYLNPEYLLLKGNSEYH